jgi:hypothetical protein
VKLNGYSELFRIYIIDATSFSKSLIGRIVLPLIFFSIDIITLIAEIAISIFTMILLKKNVNKKKFLIEIKITVNLNKNKVSTYSSDFSLQKKSSIIKDQNIRIKEDYLSKFNRNLTYSVLIICFFSTLTHLLTFICTFVFLFSNDLTAFTICFCSIFLIAFKSFINFFIFILFNGLFLKELKNIFGKN